MQEAKEFFEAWRKEYNEIQPHSSVDDQTPAEHTQQLLNEAAQAANNGTGLAEAELPAYGR